MLSGLSGLVPGVGGAAKPGEAAKAEAPAQRAPEPAKAEGDKPVPAPTNS
jgi:hypothetical protein